MTKVHFHISMSLDGFVTGPKEGVGNPLGDDDGRLHDWMFDEKTEANAEVLDEVYARTGAILMAKRMFDVGVEPWGDPPPFERPVFVITHEARDPMPMQGGTTYNFVTGGIEAGLEQAQAAAGAPADPASAAGALCAPAVNALAEREPAGVLAGSRSGPAALTPSPAWGRSGRRSHACSPARRAARAAPAAGSRGCTDREPPA
jgi:dihydrofolate reductase